MYVLFERFRFVSVRKIEPLVFVTFFVLEYAISVGRVEFVDMFPVEIELVSVTEPDVDGFPDWLMPAIVDEEIEMVPAAEAEVL